MIELNSVEQQCLEVLTMVRDHFDTRKKVGRTRFRDVMGMVGMVIACLENKQFGCFHGLHAGHCDCTPEAPGRSVKWKRIGRAKK